MIVMMMMMMVMIIIIIMNADNEMTQRISPLNIFVL